MLNRNTIYKFINKNNKLNIMNYQPINCTLYDRIELLAVKNVSVEIVHLNESAIEEKEVGKIKNIYSEAKSEFLLINNTKIRLDKIKSISEH
jgi:transcriptional antiterminator Rof (Rho-off)